jgi:Protein of unknown function (DUF3027).
MARKPKLDTILADAVDVARNALTEIAVDTEIGEYLGATSEGERLVTHRFVSQKKGCRGWTWFATLARVPRAKAKDLTVCEAGIVAGEDALLAPAWLPWADRLAKEEIEAAEADNATDESGQVSPEGQSGASTEKDSAATQESVKSGFEEVADGVTQNESAESAEANVVESIKTPARRQVRRRRTAQRTAARRRAAQRSRPRKENLD